MNKYLSFKLALLLPTCLIGCVGVGPKGEAIKITEVLSQVNSAVEEAATSSQMTNIKITSVELSLQLGVDVDAGADYPIGITTLTGDASVQHLNHVSLSFVPVTSPRAPGSVEAPKKTSELAKAIKSLYQDLPKNDANFKFKQGSIQIQCSFKNEVGIGLRLIPLPLSLDASKETAQSITLNFSSTDVDDSKTPAGAKELR